MHEERAFPNLLYDFIIFIYNSSQTRVIRSIRNCYTVEYRRRNNPRVGKGRNAEDLTSCLRANVCTEHTLTEPRRFVAKFAKQTITSPSGGNPIYSRLYHWERQIYILFSTVNNYKKKTLCSYFMSKQL